MEEGVFEDARGGFSVMLSLKVSLDFNASTENVTIDSTSGGQREATSCELKSFLELLTSSKPPDRAPPDKSSVKVEPKSSKISRPILTRKTKRKLRHLARVLRASWVSGTTPPISGVFKQLRYRKAASTHLEVTYFFSRKAHCQRFPNYS